MDIQILKELGLTSNEIEIFLVLAKKGLMSATDVAKDTGLNRPYVYYALERLLEKGYISEINVRGKKNFQALESGQIISLEEEKIGVFKEFMKDLEKIRKSRDKEISVEVFKGRYVVKNIFKKCFSEILPNEEIVYLGIDEEKMEEIEPIYLEKMINYFNKHNISERVIIKNGGKKLPYVKTTQYRHLDKKILGNTAKIIYHNKVIELIYSNPIYAIVIENEELAKTAKEQFEVFWKIAKK
ncbi:MAG: helix-turn-helix domain-containing protein [Nanoarchaeota archaeon]|nr:helix-turn-helix domain-containing protein [Nanoarchaeota archaeon]